MNAKVTSQGRIYDLDALRVKHARSEGLTFGELTALEEARHTPTIARQPALATGIAMKRGPRAIVLVAKMADGREQTIKTLNPDDTVKSVVWAEVRKLADAQRTQDAKLTEAQAFVQACDSAAGAPLMAIYRHPDAGLTVAKWIERAEQVDTIAPKRARVDALAAELMASKRLTIEQARVAVWDTHPELRW
ncbi:MAG: hypothetical protein ABI629_25765 [bacterium]